MFPEASSSSSCCQEMSRLLAATSSSSSSLIAQPNTLTNEMTGAFTRIVRGDSFRLELARGGGSGGSTALAAAKGLPTSASLPPARILDLNVEVRTATQELDFSWTAPGEDFDSGECVVQFFSFANFFFS